MLQVEDAEFVMAKDLTISTALDCFNCYVNVRSLSNGFLLVSLVNTRVSLEEVCLPSFEIWNCWLNFVASCLDDENELLLKEMASFAASRFALPSISLIVLHSLVRSVFGPWFQQSISIFVVCARRFGSGCLYSILVIQVRWGLFTEVI